MCLPSNVLGVLEQLRTGWAQLEVDQGRCRKVPRGACVLRMMLPLLCTRLFYGLCMNHTVLSNGHALQSLCLYLNGWNIL
jgi:hypothetical protein